MSRWKFTFDAIDPEDVSSTWKIGISELHHRKLVNQGHDQKLARIVLVGEVAEDPLALYRGWNRLGKHDKCWAYVGQPKDDYHKISPMICVPAPKGFLFVLFVLEDGTIDDWAWRRHVEGNETMPIGVEGEPLWERNKI